MPNRVLREGLRASEAINALSDAAERLYIRLLVSADDYGLIEMRPSWVKAHAVPLLEWSMPTVAKLLSELVDNGLVMPYEVNGKQYAAIARWSQRIEAKHPKFPMPSWGRAHIIGGLDRSSRERSKTSGEMPTGHPLDAHSTPTPEDRGTRNEERQNPLSGEAPDDGRSSLGGSEAKRQQRQVDERFVEFWAAFPRKVAKQEALKVWRRLKLSDEDRIRVMAGLEAAKRSEQWGRDQGKFIPHAATWLNGRRWEDDFSPAQPVGPERAERMRIFAEDSAGNLTELDDCTPGEPEAIARATFAKYRSAPWMRGARNIVTRLNGAHTRFSISQLGESVR